MDQNSNEYKLNFVIPQGPTGPGSEQDVCFVSYMEARNSGYLKIENTILVPLVNNAYTVNGNEVLVESGIYEITYSGILQKTDENTQVILNLGTTKNGALTLLNDMTVHLMGPQETTNFSSTGVFEFDSVQTLVVNLGRVGTGTINASSVNILIRKLSN